MEDTEFRDREYRPEEDLDEQQETSFGGSPIRQREEKSLLESPDPPRFEPTSDHPRLAAQREELEDLADAAQLKTFLLEKLGTKTSKTVGEKSKYLYENTEIVRNKKSGKILGLKYKGVQVVVKENQFSENKRSSTAVENFKIALKDAEREYNGSLSSVVDNIAGTFDENVNETVKKDYIERLERDIKNAQNEMKTFMDEKERELKNRDAEIKKLKLEIQAKDRKEEKLKHDIEKKKSDLRKLDQELSAQAILQGKELAEKERKNNAEISRMREEIQNIKSTSEEKLLEQIKRLEDESRTKNAREIKKLENQIAQDRDKKDELEERVQLLRASIKQVEDENLRLRTQSVDPETRDKINRIGNEKQTLESELAAVRKSRDEAQNLLNKQNQNLANPNTATFTKQELREINGAFKKKILEREDLSPQKKIDLLQIEQKHWRDKFTREADPMRKSMFENVQSLYNDQMEKLFAEMGKPPQSKRGKEKLGQAIKKNELRWFRIVLKSLDFLERNKLTIGGIAVSVLVSAAFGLTDLLYTARKQTERISDKIVELAASLKQTLTRQDSQQDLQQDLQKDLQQDSALQEQLRELKTQQEQKLKLEQKELAQEKTKLVEMEADKTQDKTQEIEKQKQVVQEKSKNVQETKQQTQQLQKLEDALVTLQKSLQEQKTKSTNLQRQLTQQAQKQLELQQQLREAQSKHEKAEIQHQMKLEQEKQRETQQQMQLQETKHKNLEQDAKLKNLEREIQQLLQKSAAESKKQDSKTTQPDGGGDPSSTLPYAWQRKIAKNLLYYLGIAAAFLLKYLGIFVFWMAQHLITVFILAFTFVVYKFFKRRR